MAAQALKADLVQQRLEKGLLDKVITPAFALEQAKAAGLIAYARLVESLVRYEERKAKKLALAAQAAKVVMLSSGKPVAPLTAEERERRASVSKQAA